MRRKHTGPLDGQITISEKRHRKSTMKCEGIALRFVVEGMFLKKLHSKWKKFEKVINPGKGVAWKKVKK
jgi:hypothetical protein